MDLEEQFHESEASRKKILEKVELAKLGEDLPGSAKATLKQIEQLRATFSDLLEAKAYRQVGKVLDVIQSRVEAMEELRAFSIEIDGLTKALNTMMAGIQGSHSMLVSLNKQLTAEFEERRKHRQLAQQALSKLNTYLDNWR